MVHVVHVVHKLLKCCKMQHFIAFCTETNTFIVLQLIRNVNALLFYAIRTNPAKVHHPGFQFTHYNTFSETIIMKNATMNIVNDQCPGSTDCALLWHKLPDGRKTMKTEHWTGTCSASLSRALSVSTDCVLAWHAVTDNNHLTLNINIVNTFFHFLKEGVFSKNMSK